MNRAVYDVEANGLLVPIYDKKTDTLQSIVNTVWCVIIHDMQTGEVLTYGPNNLINAYKKLQEYDLLIGHNACGYDRHVMEGLIGMPNNLGPLPRHGDTLIMSKLLFGPKKAPTPDGRHSLASWGKFLGSYKGDYTDFSKYTPEMLLYCKQDVKVNVELYMYLYSKMTPDLARAYVTECKISEIMAKQIMQGMHLDLVQHTDLMQVLEIGLAEARDELSKTIPNKIKYFKTPQYYTDSETDRRYSLKGEAESAKIKKRLVDGPLRFEEIPFNPNSPNQLIEFLVKTKGWKPQKFTDAGNPETGAKILENLPYPEMEAILNYRICDKRLSQCSSWLNFMVEGRIHGSVNSSGAATWRMTHSLPNLAQVPAARKPYGKECRACWIPPPGMMMTGTDAKGLELRCLGNALAPYDGGRYMTLVLSGEIHNRNMELLGLDDRDDAKTVIYAFNYSAGLLKLGMLCTDSESLNEEAKSVKLPPVYVQYLREQGWYNNTNIRYAKIGMCVRKRLYADITGLEELIAALKKENKEKGYITGIDGRRIFVSEEYSILNRRLQSDGGILMKYALLVHLALMEAEFSLHGARWGYMVNVHDEWQIWHEPVMAERAREIGNDSIRIAGEQLGFAIPLAGDSSSGYNWYETH